jgi:hypothetical protein
MSLDLSEDWKSCITASIAALSSGVPTALGGAANTEPANKPIAINIARIHLCIAIPGK